MALTTAVHAALFIIERNRDYHRSLSTLPASQFAQRRIAVRTAMREADLAVLLLFSMISSPYEVHYLSNFPATWETLLVFPIEGEPTLLLELYNHVPNARQIASIPDVRWGGGRT